MKDWSWWLVAVALSPFIGLGYLTVLDKVCDKVGWHLSSSGAAGVVFSVLALLLVGWAVAISVARKRKQ